ncbi:MAG: methylenetetrahydrofolate reductase C-terminal domain-containing protein [Desulfobulbaceae bacterium]|nr:methylenetetrahydrofolate reductase C-terminal domain-containing protein [Desulfobulbaceae bacterium]
MPKQNEFSKSLADPDEFTVTYELVPGQGSGGRKLERLLDFARSAKEDGRIRALSITDNPGGGPALAPFAIGSDIQQIGIEPLLHFSLKDKNRNQIESHLFHYHRQNFNNLLVLGGDFPRPSYYGQAKPVFDLDSVQTLRLMRDMEEGTYRGVSNSKIAPFDPLAFNRGCVVSPFKAAESEQIWQYAKLIKKIDAGGDFIITQLGYDICKFEELIRFLRVQNIGVPVLGNVFVPSTAVARLMHRGKVPGIVFPEQLVHQMEQEERDNRREARLLRAAKMICILKGLGYSGVHLGGNGLNFANVRFILDHAGQMAGNWDELRGDVHFPVPGTWYIYKQERPGACGKEKNDLHPGHLHRRQKVPRLMHRLLFSPPHPMSRIFGRICLFCERTRLRTAVLRNFERWIKSFLFYCKMCGDCTLQESTYICPQSGCPKKLLNGPCGGSRNMTCEVFPDRYCFWVRVYDREGKSSTIEQFGRTTYLPPKNWALDQTSSWINFYAGRDHCRIRFDPPEKLEGMSGNGR